MNYEAETQWENDNQALGISKEDLRTEHENENS